MRDHGATSTTIETPPAPTAAFTWRRPSFNLPSTHFSLGPDELELLAAALGQLDRLEPQLEHGRRQLGELRRRARAGADRGRRSARAA